MKHIYIASVIAAALAGAAACGRVEQPIAPSPTPGLAATQSFSSWDAFSPVPGSARVFSYSAPASRVVTGYTPQSRFVLYEDKRFALQYGSLGVEYRGTYQQSDNALTFDWEGWSAAGPWGASGQLSGDLLTVRYNLIMQLTDFEDAVYSLAR